MKRQDLRIGLGITRGVASILRRIAQALHPESDGGRRITPTETVEILAAAPDAAVREILGSDAEGIRARAIDFRQRRSRAVDPR